jgi:hypothetical protein
MRRLSLLVLCAACGCTVYLPAPNTQRVQVVQDPEAVQVITEPSPDIFETLHSALGVAEHYEEWQALRWGRKNLDRFYDDRHHDRGPGRHGGYYYHGYNSTADYNAWLLHRLENERCR